MSPCEAGRAAWGRGSHSPLGCCRLWNLQGRARLTGPSLPADHPTPRCLPPTRGWPSTSRNHSPQSTKRRGSARAVAPRARSKASEDTTMTSASAGTAAPSPRRHVSSAAPPAGQLGGAPPRGGTARSRGSAGTLPRWQRVRKGGWAGPPRAAAGSEQLEHRRDCSGTAADWMGEITTVLELQRLDRPSAMALLLEIPAPGLYCRIQR